MKVMRLKPIWGITLKPVSGPWDSSDTGSYMDEFRG